MFELGLGRQNVFSEIEAPYTEKEVFDNYMPVNLSHINLKLFLLFVGHYAEHAVRVARVIKPCIVREKAIIEIAIYKLFLQAQQL